MQMMKENKLQQSNIQTILSQNITAISSIEYHETCHNFYLSVATHEIVSADLSLRSYSLTLLALHIMKSMF